MRFLKFSKITSIKLCVQYSFEWSLKSKFGILWVWESQVFINSYFTKQSLLYSNWVKTIDLDCAYESQIISKLILLLND